MTACEDQPLGATYLGEGRCRFLVWAPKANRVAVKLVEPSPRLVPLEPLARGYFHGILEEVTPGTRYWYQLDDHKERPDPASRSQPNGVHGPSQVIDPHFVWEDGPWRGLPLRDYVLYELHVGTFTSEGTFDAVIPHLDELVRLGITVVELMPIAQFPGKRNWGYDGTFCFAAQNSYGGPDGLRRLVNACHQRGLGVALDVVYNHLGPEGNYLADFGYYFSDRYRTPWGWAINFDHRHSDEVRRYFRENALAWVMDFHIDSLRLDAVHAIFDESARPFLRELGQAVHERAEQLQRPITVIAESNKNDTRHTDTVASGGYGLDAQWNDDFHHALHALLTAEHAGCYEDFGGLAQLAKALGEGFVHTGGYSHYRGRRHGVSSARVSAEHLIVFGQNHDQIGNRARGERLAALVSYDSLKLAAGIVLLSPYVPLLFMGEEYAETAPFLYFVHHSDPQLIDAVRRGRREAFDSFGWNQELPDPQLERTFHGSRLHHELRQQTAHAGLWRYYQELLRLRKSLPALRRLDKRQMEVVACEATTTLLVRRYDGDSDVAWIGHFGGETNWPAPLPGGHWEKLLDSADPQWHGTGSSLPAELRSQGEAVLRLAPSQFVVWTRRGTA